MRFHPVYLNETDSTNIQCKRLAREGAPHGTVVIAARQTAGRGRLGRTFVSPDKAGLYCSVLIREGISYETIGLVTPCTAVAAARAIDSAAGTCSGIKWVNDIFLSEKKVCGILTEGSLPEYLVIGIGINLRSVKKSFPEELQRIVTSVEDETGRVITPEAMADVLLPCLAEELMKLPDRDFLREYQKRSVLMGKQVKICGSGEPYEAQVIGIDDEAGLVVRLPDGEVRTLHTGEVSVRFA